MAKGKNPVGSSARVLRPGQWLRGDAVSLRLVAENDCNEIYASWLADPSVNQYLETRWQTQSMSAIRTFVRQTLKSRDNYLFAIVNSEGRHIGNIKVGPIREHHAYADVSFFIGDRDSWGRGYATEAIRLATAFGFERLNLHRLQAGLYRSNKASARALEKAGYQREGRFRRQLLGPSGNWEDHEWYGALRDEWV